MAKNDVPSTKIEGWAVQKIERMIDRCPRLKSNLDRADRIPFTDGSVDIYQSPAQSNDQFVGRVAVQVKGKISRLGRARTYPVRVDDLRAYEKQGGVVYFVVTMTRDGRSPKPYYAALNPFRIAGLLRTAGGQKTKAVPFEPLPSDPVKIERIMRFIDASRVQSTSTGFDPVIMENATSFSITTPVELDYTSSVKLRQDDIPFSLVVTTAGGLSVPLDGYMEILHEEQSEQVHDVPFRSGGHQYDQVRLRRHDDHTVEVELAKGASFTMTYQGPGSISMNLSLSPRGNLAARIKALEFVIAMFETNRIEIGDKTFSLGELSPRADDGEAPLTQMRDHLEKLRRARQALQAFGADELLIEDQDLDLESIDRLDQMYRGIVLGEELQMDDSPGSRVHHVDVGRWWLIIVRTEGTSEGRWRVADLLRMKPDTYRFRMSAEVDGEEVSCPATAFETIQDRDLHKVLNLHLDDIVDVYANLNSELSGYLSNRRVLALIHAADSCASRQAELLEAAERLNEWVIEQDPGSQDHKVNRWQIHKRMAGITEVERAEIRKVKWSAARGQREGDDVRAFACALLLDEQEEADFILAQIKPENIEEMRGWPIWKLRKSE